MDQGLSGLDDQDVEQVTDLVGGQVQELTAAAVARAGSGAGGVGDQDGEDRQREHRQRGMPVPTGPASDLVVIEPDLALRSLKLSSTAQRVPATRTRRFSGTGLGAQHR